MAGDVALERLRSRRPAARDVPHRRPERARSPHRRVRVVGHLARPDQQPQRRGDVGGALAGRQHQVAEERAALRHPLAQQRRQVAVGGECTGRRPQQRRVVAEVEGHATVARRRTRRPRRPRRGRPAAPAGSPSRGGRAPPRSRIAAGSGTPCSCTSTSRRRSGPPRAPSSTPCQRGQEARQRLARHRPRPRRAGAPASARRMRRSTSESHHSSPWPPGRIAPRTTVPSTSRTRSSSSTRCSGTPKRAAGCSAVNGPCVRA